MKMKKMFALLLAMMMVITMVAGCGGDNTTDDEGGNATTYDNSITVIWDSSAFLYDFENIDSAITKAEKEIASGMTKDSPLVQAQIANTKLIRDWAAEKEYNITSVAWGWADSLTSKLNAAFLAKEGPDLILGETQMPKYAADGNLVAFPDDLAAYIRENCSPAAYQDMEYDGKIYGICLTPSPTILVWNKDILKQTASYGEGTSVYENGPKDWAEWEAVMKEVDALNSTQKYAGGVYCAGNYGGYLRVGALMNGAGGGYADASGNPAINTAENKLAMEFVRKTYSHTIPGILNAIQDSDYLTAFDRGNLAYKMDGVWSIYESQNLNFECGFAPVPGIKEGESSNMLIGAAYMGVPTYSNNQEIVFDLIKRMIQEDIQSNIGNAGLRTPVLKSVITSETYKQAHPELYTFANNMLDGSVRGLPVFVHNQMDLWDAVGDALNSILTTDQDITAVLATAQGAMEKANQPNK